LTLWAFFGNSVIGQQVATAGWLHLWTLVPLFLLVYGFFSLYPGVSACPVDEIRRVFLANSSAFVFVSLILASHQGKVISWVICLFACIFASVVETLMRAAVRHIGSHFSWWGYPVVLFGSGMIARQILRKLKSQPHLGLRPVAVVAISSNERTIEGVPVHEFEYLDYIASSGVRHAVVAAPELTKSEFAAVIEGCSRAFHHLILIPDMDSVLKIGSLTRDFTGFLGLQVGNNLLHLSSRIAKRTIDLICATFLLIFLFPLLAVISLLVLMESGFPILYLQKRLGYEGRTFHIWKFRTMVKNSSEVLKMYLETNPDLRLEWECDQKLREDPRITHIGKFLRKSSLDELPQLWNVLRGDMSLVGPRPIVDNEISKYDEAYFLYQKVTPGLTGLWQVSGRNKTSYEERVAFDTYYVRNWSVWMDFYLLAKTVGVVLTGDGAY
jgi:Undecaprenyl-phosphate galactose phosphotransferase WbaP